MKPVVREQCFEQNEFAARARLKQGANFPYPSHLHEAWELTLMCRGKSSCTIGRKSHQMVRGSLACVRPNQEHSYGPSQGPGSKRAVMVLSGDLLNGNIPATATLRGLSRLGITALSDSTTTRLEVLMGEIVEEYEKRQHNWQTYILACIERLLIILDRELHVHSTLLLDNPTVTEALACINDRCREGITLTELAAYCGTSRFHLSRLIKKHAGVGFRDYLVSCKLANAKHLLETTDKKILCVALESGFENLSTFNRDFRLATRMTPLQYRKICSGTLSIGHTLPEK